jgi:iron(III) transport system ATP-binding protein
VEAATRSLETAALETAGLEVAGLCKSYGDHAVLSGVDLRVPEGSFTAILGPSGSGKTTLLRLLAGFERPDAGRIVLGGQVVEGGDGRHVRPERRHLGYVPQEGALFPHLSVEANVRFGLGRLERRTKRVAELLDLVGLADMGRRYPHQLSGGQQQRVALARALAVRPRVVLLDEPFSSLDASLRASVREEVRVILAEAETTAVLVTHDQDEALSLADLVAVLRGGRIVQQGTPNELYTRPVDAELARFVGDANLCRGTLRSGRVETLLGVLDLADPARSWPDGTQAPDGTEVIVLVRPEQVVVEALGSTSIPPGGRGRLLGTVSRVDFHGHDSVLSVAVPSAQGSGQVAQLRARLAGAQAPEPGSNVALVASGPVIAWRDDSPQGNEVLPGPRSAGTDTAGLVVGRS